MTVKTSFSCGESLNIAHVSNLYQRLVKALEKTSNIELKADKVEKADTAGLQLFLALKKEVANGGGQLNWKNPSDALIAAAKQLGLYEQLNF